LKKYKTIIASLAVANIMFTPMFVRADNTYEVTGNSMYPTLKNGDEIRVMDTNYKDGDTVLGRLSNGDNIVKRLSGNFLVGDNGRSLNIPKEDVNIVGRVEKNMDEDGYNVYSTNTAKALEMDSPIEKAYAGNEYALFLHKDTSVTGFGANINNVLGMTSGEDKNTSNWVKVSDPTGFKYIQASNYYAHGFRPLPNNPDLYRMIRIKEDTTQDDIGVPVKNAGWVYQDTTWSHHKAWIDENNQFWMRGDDVNNGIGIGQNIPYGVHTDSNNRTYKVISPEPRKTLVADSSFTNSNNYDDNVVVETNPFTITEGDWEILWTFSVKPNVAYDDSFIHMELIDENGNVVYTGPKDNFFRSQNHIRNPRAIAISSMHNTFKTNGTFKLRVTSSKIGWSFTIRDRKYLEQGDVKRYIPGNAEGRWVIEDKNDDVYLHNVSWGQLRKVNFPNGVKIKAETITGGISDYYTGLDTNGELWRWYFNNTTPVKITMPTDFYQNFSIEEISNGLNHFLLKVKEKISSKTYVMSFGNNEYGKLGLSTDKIAIGGTLNTPVFIEKNGVPLENIQSVAAGQQFSVIVQNTSDGQLVWSFGRNNKGQLGGNNSMGIAEPFIIPGLKGIDKIFNRQYTTYALDDDTQTIYSAGADRSYMDTTTFSGLGYIESLSMKLSSSTTAYLKKEDKSLWTDNYGCYAESGRLTQSTTYGPVETSSQAVIYSTKAVKNVYDFSKLFNNGKSSFSNVRDYDQNTCAGNLVDENGRLWGYGATDRKLGTGYHNDVYGKNSISAATNGAYPAKLDFDTFAPAIFTSVARVSSNIGWALDENGQIWLMNYYLQRIPAQEAINNVKVKKIFSTVDSLFAVDENGDLWASLGNSYGQLGLGNKSATIYPVKIDKKYYEGKVIDVSGSSYHTIFVTDKGYVYAMGKNNLGQLGNGNFVESTVPVRVKNVENAIDVSAYQNYSVALDKSGRVWGWGNQTYGSLGNNYSMSRNNPSTSVGNEIPEMEVKTNLEPVYLSKNGNKTFKMQGTILEKEGEKTTIKTKILGVEKNVTVEDWTADVYNKIVPQNWVMEWNVNEFGSEQVYQGLTKLEAEDTRGGYLENFFAGKITVDNEKPQVPNWGETCSVTSSNIQGLGLEFDGADDYVKLGSFSGLTSGATFEAWVYPTNNATWSRIFDFGLSDTPSNSGNENIFFARSGDTTSLEYIVYKGKDPYTVKTSNTLELNKWQHLAVTHATNGDVRIYKNGVQIASGNIPFPNNVVRNSNYIGKSNWDRDSYYKGQLTEFRMWNKTLTQQDIQANMNKRLSGAESGLLGYWSLDESKATEYTGKQSIGSIIGASPVLTSLPLPDQKGLSMKFDGADDSVVVSDFSDQVLQNSFTVETWVKFDKVSKGSDNGIFTHGSKGDTRQNLHLTERNGKFYFGFYGDDLWGVTTLQDNTWYHVAFVYDANTSYQQIYVNGKLDAQRKSGQYIGIGNTVNIGNYGGNRLMGNLKDLRVWSKAKTQTEIEAEMNKRFTGTDTNLYAYWKMNDYLNGTSSIQDYSKINHTGVVVGGAQVIIDSKMLTDDDTNLKFNLGKTQYPDASPVKTCYGDDYFKANGNNGIDKPVRLYFKPIQKTGDYKAPVIIQIKYRKKEAYGYPPTWSDWITVETYDNTGYYYDFYKGFQGETQVKIRAYDKAGNISEENPDSRYVLITNAGGEVDQLFARTDSVEKQLQNELTFTGVSPSSSAIKSFSVFRREIGKEDWTSLTPARVLWGTGSEKTYLDNLGDLSGNTSYEYKVDIENTVGIGKGKTILVTTNPYEPTNFIRKITNNGIDFTVKQDTRNKGEILYRLVIVDNQTGEIYHLDKKSSNLKEEVIFKVKEGDAPFSILNNSMGIKLLVKGKNDNFITIIYDENFENTPSIVTDKKAPEVYVNVKGSPERIISNGNNKISLDLSATDDVTVNNKLEVQFSSDGTNWYGLNTSNQWEQNAWSNYSNNYIDFPLGTSTGTKVIYARVKDEAGNIGMANTQLIVAELVNRDGTSKVVDSDRNLSSEDTVNNSIHVNDSYITLNIPKTGNLKEVQFSFDGVNWSPWEPLYDKDVKYITLPPIQGEHNVFVRYRNEFGDTTQVTQKNDIIKYVLDTEKPNLKFETQNGTYIVKDSSALVTLIAVDNLSPVVRIELENPEFAIEQNGVTKNSLDVVNKAKNPVLIKGLQNGFNVVSFKVTDKAGNVKLTSVRIFKKS